MENAVRKKGPGKTQYENERRRIFEDWKAVVDQTFLEATRDPLTGLPNRSALQERLGIALSESERHQEILAVLFIDLDAFGAVNKLHGHLVGDEVLTEVALKLSQVLRPEDVIARMGGDEFVALIRRLQSPVQAEYIAARLLKRLERPLRLKGKCLSISASIGISLYPFQGSDGQTLLKNADAAMFRVKQRGGRGLEFFAKPAISLFPKEVTMMPRKKVLIVDDDADFQSVLRQRLKMDGYACYCSPSVESALKRVRAVDPDLVILDLGFKGASGLAFLENISRMIKDGQKCPPVLVMSGYTDPEIVQFVTTLGASQFLPKPASLAQIVGAVRAAVH